ncbi:GGDEF domain-containing protein [bacterium]|nr:GGDEF domain-containing protein [bacterium]MBU1990745.1 GGDEF domain-containing protein [bacterium]
MDNILPDTWLSNLEKLDIAFQPILNVHTGNLFAVEALLRNYKDIGFDSIFSLFDQVYKEELLYTFDLALREKTIQKFTKIDNYQEIKLFYNLDNRLLQMANFSDGNTNKILKDKGIKKDSICFEISERHEITGSCNLENIIRHYKNENFCIAIDDFGVGYSGYKLLYDMTPNVIKIDRFFLKDIAKDPKKKLMVQNITHLAIQLGINVIAEGVEEKEELLICKNIGCHMVQGYFIQKPSKDTKKILKSYKHISDLIKNDERSSNKNIKIKSYIDKIPPIDIQSNMSLVIDYFKQYKEVSAVAIINAIHEPLGILQENQIKEYLYSPYGRSLLLNDSTNKSKLKHLIKPCGTTDISSDISTIIELFSNNPESAGIIITKNSKYYGLLSARAIIGVMNEENLLYAREQNPLTKLPGNVMIEKYILDASRYKDAYIFCYFDLDNFKAYNDVYGFRNGDRVIQLFADILRKHLPNEFFKAHIGGDDFFIALRFKEDASSILKHITNIIKKFTSDVKEFYSKEDKKRGYITAMDRDKNKKQFPLLSVSASVLILSDKTKERCLKNINSILAEQKKVAKNEFTHLSVSSLL